MTARAGAGRCHRDLARVGLRVGDQLRNGLGRQRRIGQHDLRLPNRARNRRDVAKKHETELVVERRVDGARRADHEERVAVGGRAHDRLGCDIGGGARPVFDDERLAEPLLQPLSDQARADVAGAAGSETDDDAHRPRRIGLRPCDARHRRHRHGAHCETQKSTARKLHGTPSKDKSPSAGLSRHSVQFLMSCKNHSVGSMRPRPCSFARRYTTAPTDENCRPQFPTGRYWVIWSRLVRPGALPEITSA